MSKESARAWRKKYPDKHASTQARRRARKRNLLCPTRDDKAISKLYAEARALSEELGVSFHVDHIIPLCKEGLHHEDNLQVVQADYNLSKGSKEIFNDTIR